MRTSSFRVGVVLMAVTIVSVGCGGVASHPSSTSTKASTTRAPTSTSIAAALSTAVWPWAASNVRYSTPTDATKGFASDYLHMTAPIIGPFKQGDARSGEVSVRASATGPETTVLVRQLGADNSWWVLGAAAVDISLTQPIWDTALKSPAVLAGTSVAFEGTVQAQVRSDDVTHALGAGFVTGGSTSRGPFSGSLSFSSPTAQAGAVVLFIRSAKDGSVLEATVVRVRFG